jgi:hypothetical protein
MLGEMVDHIEPIAGAFGAFDSFYMRIMLTFDSMKVLLREIVIAIMEFQVVVARLIKIGMEDFLTRMNAAIKNQKALLEKDKQQIEAYIIALAQMQTGSTKTEESLRKLNEEIVNTGISIDDFDDKYIKLYKSLATGKTEMDKFMDTVKSFKILLYDLDALFAHFDIVPEAFFLQGKEAQKVFWKYNQELERMIQNYILLSSLRFGVFPPLKKPKKDDPVVTAKNAKAEMFEGSASILSASASLFTAAAELNNTSGGLEDASGLQKASAVAMGLAALAQSFAAMATASSIFNFQGIAASLGAIASILGLISTISSLEKGGLASKGPGSLPDIPQADTGMYTGSLPPDGMLVNVHADEWILPKKYLKNAFGNMAENLFSSGHMPIPEMGFGGGGNININITATGGDLYNRPFWDNVVNVSILPAMKRVNRNRGAF